MVSRVINTMVTNLKRNDLSKFRPTMSSSYKLLKVSRLLSKRALVVNLFIFRADSNLQISADPESYFSPLPQPEPDLHEKADVEKQ